MSHAGNNPPFSYQLPASNVYFSNANISALTGTTRVNYSASRRPYHLEYHYPLPGLPMYSSGVQREANPGIVGALQYVGPSGWHQNDDRAINTLPLNSSTAFAKALRLATLKKDPL